MTLAEILLFLLLLAATTAALIVARKISQKNADLQATLQRQTSDHQAFAARFTSITDVEAEALEVKQDLQEEHQRLQDEIVSAKASHASFLEQHSSERTSLEEQYTTANKTYEDLKREVALLEENLEDMSFGLYEPHFDFETSEDYKAELKAVRDRQRELIRSGLATHCATEWTVGESRAKGRKMERQYTKLLLRAFNGECDAAVANISWNNASKMEQRVRKALEAINKLGGVMNMSITSEFFEEKLKEIRVTHEHKEKRNQEREEQRQLRQQKREQEKAEREIEQVRKEAEREELRTQEALVKARDEAERATGKQLKKLTEQIASLERRVSEAHERKEKAIARAQLTRSGFIYVISNEGSFGKGVVKIGMTRRMEPMDRIKELGDASVPFPFDLHVMMFSEDAPTLESALHSHFDSRRLNLVNPRKEFYRDVELDEVEQFIRAQGVTAQFVKLVEAREFRETQSILATSGQSDAETDGEFPESPFT